MHFMTADIPHEWTQVTKKYKREMWVWGQCSKNPRVKLLSSCIFIVTVWVDLQVGSVWDFYC